MLVYQQFCYWVRIIYTPTGYDSKHACQSSNSNSQRAQGLFFRGSRFSGYQSRLIQWASERGSKPNTRIFCLTKNGSIAGTTKGCLRYPGFPIISILRHIRENIGNAKHAFIYGSYGRQYVQGQVYLQVHLHSDSGYGCGR